MKVGKIGAVAGVIAWLLLAQIVVTRAEPGIFLAISAVAMIGPAYLFGGLVSVLVGEVD